MEESTHQTTSDAIKHLEKIVQEKEELLHEANEKIVKLEEQQVLNRNLNDQISKEKDEALHLKQEK
jgi:hypothetical protein